MRDIVAGVIFLTMLTALGGGTLYVAENWPAYVTAGPMKEPWRPGSL